MLQGRAMRLAGHTGGGDGWDCGTLARFFSDGAARSNALWPKNVTCPSQGGMASDVWGRRRFFRFRLKICLLAIFPKPSRLNIVQTLPG
jgi:hypothetical protein